MPVIDRRILITVPIIAIAVFLLGFSIGKATSGVSTETSGDSTATMPQVVSGSQDGSVVGEAPVTGAAAALPPSAPDAEDRPEYGTEEDRQALIAGLAEASVSVRSDTDVLATADHVCYNLERLRIQGRSHTFAVRVVWNESLMELDSKDLAAFGAVFSAAPYYLCPDSITYGENIAYWLGY